MTSHRPNNTRRTSSPRKGEGRTSGRRVNAQGGTRPERRASTSSSRSSQASSARRSNASSAASSRASSSPKRQSTTRSRTASTRSYNTPSLWTKDAAGAAQPQGRVHQILSILGSALTTIARLIAAAAVAAIGALASLRRRSVPAFAAVLAVIVLAVGGLVDAGVHAGRAYPGVHVGEVDVAGKTTEEIAQLVNETYAPRLAQGSATIYASDEAAAAGAAAQSDAEAAALAEQITADEQRATTTSWTATATELGASLSSEYLAEQAVAVGRDEGGFFARIGALFGGWVVNVAADYDASKLETIAQEIDTVIGEARVDFGIAVSDGYATVTEGHDGNMIDRTVFAEQLTAAFLSDASGAGSFVAHAEYAPLRVDHDEAQAVCDTVNAAIADGARLIHGNDAWDVDRAELGSWIVGSVVERDGGWTLQAFVDEAKAKPGIVAFAGKQDGDGLTVLFEVGDDDSVSVHASGAQEIPLAAETADALNEALFGSGSKAEGQPVEIAVSTGSLPETTSFDEAIDLGIVQALAAYTTEFTTGTGTENRNHNIALVSQLLNNSVVEPGGTWSFNTTAGECNEDAGFLGAGAIVDGEYDDAVGGGICQVATTVFNAVYDSGFPVVTRHNHSLYISSYPVGRDAAVSWPDLDLVWENDSESAVLVRVSCADSSVTATLYGVDPGYQVSSDVGAWEEGEEHATKTTVDETLAPGTSYIKTRGTDGSKITVVRSVRDAAGSLLRQDTFTSVYDPVTEVVVEGPSASKSG